MAYSKQLGERFENVLNNPEKFNVGRFDPKDPSVATGMVGAPSCGDVMKLQLKLDHEERIVDVKFKTYGCGSAIASSTTFVEFLKGKTLEEVNILFDKFHRLCTGQIVEEDEDTETLQVLSGVSKFPTRVKCATMSWHAIKEAIHDERQTTLDN